MIPSWAVGAGWCMIYIASSILIPDNKRGRGYITRLLGKVIPPKSLWIPPVGFSYRYLLALLIFAPLNLSGVLDSDKFVIIFWPIVIGLVIDDYLNGDDDLKKRWESVKNKIKWKMDLPQPIPARVRDTGA